MASNPVRIFAVSAGAFVGTSLVALLTVLFPTLEVELALMFAALISSSVATEIAIRQQQKK